MGQGQQFLPGPPLWLFHVPYNREIPPLQGRMRGRPCRKHRETALKILSRRKPPGNVTLLATASEGPRDESFAHVLSLYSLWVHILAIFFTFFLHYALLLVPLQGRSFLPAPLAFLDPSGYCAFCRYLRKLTVSAATSRPMALLEYTATAIVPSGR